MSPAISALTLERIATAWLLITKRHSAVRNAADFLSSLNKLQCTNFHRIGVDIVYSRCIQVDTCFDKLRHCFGLGVDRLH